MKSKVNLNNKPYMFLNGYQKEESYRKALNDLVTKVFWISFEKWYRAGYMNEKYIPYTPFDGSQAVANVSVNIMDFDILGQFKRYIQIGTVATDEDYRNQGLSRFLMKRIFQELDGKCDMIYLFANKTVLNMYLKFGFEKVKEYEYFNKIENNSDSQNFHKLDMSKQLHRDMVYSYAKHSAIFGKISMQENADLVMFYCISFLKEHVYYILQNAKHKIVFFDRSILDALSFYQTLNLNDANKYSNLIANFKYFSLVFFTPPWEEIFKKDDERKHSFADAVSE